jgi:hypothetical protein
VIGTHSVEQRLHAKLAQRRFAPGSCRSGPRVDGGMDASRLLDGQAGQQDGEPVVLGVHVHVDGRHGSLTSPLSCG